MKKCFQNFCLLFLFATLLLTSCSKNPSKVLPQKNGVWNAVITYHYTSTTGYDTTSVHSTAFTFQKEGTGSYIDVSATGITFTWAYSTDTKKITYQRTGYNPVIFDVDIMERKHELWHNVFTEIIAADTFTTDLSVDFKKQD